MNMYKLLVIIIPSYSPPRRYRGFIAEKFRARRKSLQTKALVAVILAFLLAALLAAEPALA